MLDPKYGEATDKGDSIDVEIDVVKKQKMYWTLRWVASNDITIKVFAAKLENLMKEKENLPSYLVHLYLMHVITQ